MYGGFLLVLMEIISTSWTPSHLAICLYRGPIGALRGPIGIRKGLFKGPFKEPFNLPFKGPFKGPLRGPLTVLKGDNNII